MSRILINDESSTVLLKKRIVAESPAKPDARPARAQYFPQPAPVRAG